MRRRLAFLALFTFLHAIFSIVLRIASTTFTMAAGKTGEGSGLLDRGLGLLSKLFFMPVFLFLPSRSPEGLAGALGYLPIFLNSFLWALAALAIWLRWKKN